jgi:hypothetical protein
VSDPASHDADTLQLLRLQSYLGRFPRHREVVQHSSVLAGVFFAQARHYGFRPKASAVFANPPAFSFKFWPDSSLRRRCGRKISSASSDKIVPDRVNAIEPTWTAIQLLLGII